MSDPAAHHFEEAICGEQASEKWLAVHRPGLAILASALDGGPRQRKRLAALTPEQWEEVFEAVANEQLLRELQKRRAEVAGLFGAAKGNDSALETLKKHKPSYVKIVEMIREASERFVAAGNGKRHGKLLEESTAADVGCLIGEMHLGKGEYHNAVEAFTRAIENEPTADAYEGRARAYRALAALDEARDRELRGD
jgi:hypothetical protein